MPPPRAAAGSKKRKASGGTTTTSTEEEQELHALLGSFAVYHRATAEVVAADDDEKKRVAHPPVIAGVTSSRQDNLPHDARVFASHTATRHAVTRWDADELGRTAEVHTWDLVDAAAVRLNPHLVTASLREVGGCTS
jgi:hypothetical protein